MSEGYFQLPTTSCSKDNVKISIITPRFDQVNDYHHATSVFFSFQIIEKTSSF